jgi:IGR protein motif-containing protein
MLQHINVFRISGRCVRCLHSKTRTPFVPLPTPFVPDVQTFLTLIGRDMSKFASKFSSWDNLFTLTSTELRELGIEPTRQRRYLLRQREKFRRGVYGPGGDLIHVVDGVAQLRVAEVPIKTAGGDAGNPGSTPMTIASATLSPGMKRIIVNLPATETSSQHGPSHPPKKFAKMKIYRGSMIRGPFLQLIKGSNGSAALIKVQEGMWEDKRGQKVDGGERRRAEVRAKRRSKEGGK